MVMIWSDMEMNPLLLKRINSPKIRVQTRKYNNHYPLKGKNVNDCIPEFLFMRSLLSGAMMLRWIISIESWTITLFGLKKSSKKKPHSLTNSKIFKHLSICGLDVLTQECLPIKLSVWSQDNFLFTETLPTKRLCLTSMPLQLSNMPFKSSKWKISLFVVIMVVVVSEPPSKNKIMVHWNHGYHTLETLEPDIENSW